MEANEAKERSRLHPSVFCFHTGSVLLSRSEPRKELLSHTIESKSHLGTANSNNAQVYLHTEVEDANTGDPCGDAS